MAGLIIRRKDRLQPFAPSYFDGVGICFQVACAIPVSRGATQIVRARPSRLVDLTREKRSMVAIPLREKKNTIRKLGDGAISDAPIDPPELAFQRGRVEGRKRMVPAVPKLAAGHRLRFRLTGKTKGDQSTIQPLGWLFLPNMLPSAAGHSSNQAFLQPASSGWQLCAVAPACITRWIRNPRQQSHLSVNFWPEI